MMSFLKSAMLLSSMAAISVQQMSASMPVFPLLSMADTPNLFPMPQCRNFTLEEATIDQMQDAMGRGVLTSVQLVTCYVERNFQLMGYTNSLLQMNPEVLSIAQAMDDERKAGKVRGPLHGVPFLVKDNIATKDNLETTAGSWALLGSIVPRDAFVVARLREAGAVLFGKATLSEWADMRSNNYSEGYSARGGQSRSPYNFTVNPGGSSSGSAIAVAANAITFSLGTETDGSVINPAERNAVVGFKPTVGLTSRAGVIPECEHQDTVGTFGRTVRDAVYALDAIYGVDARDNYTLAQEGHAPPAPTNGGYSGGYIQYMSDFTALQGATFGIPWQSFWVYADPEQQAILLDLISLIESAGATIINNTEILDYETIVSPNGWNWDYGSTRGYANESEYTVVKVDFYNNIKTYLSELSNTNIRSLEDIVAFNYANDGTEGGYSYPEGIPAFYSGQDGFLASLATQGIRNETYYQALEFTSTSTRNGIDSALSVPDTNTSSSSSPTTPPKYISGLLVPPDVGQTYQIAAQAGYPMITIPAGVHSDSHMPFGLGIMQTAWAEPELIKWASAIEDLQFRSGTVYKRSLPRWRGYLERNIPVLNA